MINTTPTLSVVMSVYNAGDYLCKAVNSILNQTFHDFEFIIIEDCSTDNSLQILEKYAQKDGRIILIKKGQNNVAKGFIENLNIGLEKAEGKYVARMDADDIAMPNRFERQIAALKNDPDLFVIGSSLEMIDENDKMIRPLPSIPDDASIKAEMFKNIALYHPAIMFRNENVRYREKMISCEDYDLFFRWMMAGKKMANITDPLLKYRVLPASLSRKDKTFIRWMMVEKARAFYLENKKSGKDSYGTFDPENIQKITDINYKNSLQDLIFAAETAAKFSEKEELKSVLIKIKKYYPEASISKFKIAASLPNPLSKVYSKFFLS